MSRIDGGVMEKLAKPAEYYGSEKGMPQGILEERLRKAQDDVDVLAAEKVRRAHFTDAERLADRLHRLLHFGVDCDFYYSDWPNPTGCRADFRNLALRMIEAYHDEAGRKCGDRPIGNLIAMMEGVRFGSQSL
jgi:hypothetical protein